MRLRVLTPLQLVLDEPRLRSLQAEDASGSFGMLPGHAPLLTSLSLSVLRYARADGSRGYCAVRGGVLRVDAAGDVVVATPEAVPGDAIETLSAQVLARMEAELDLERAERAEAVRLELGAMRQIVRRLRGDPARLGAGPA